MQAVRVERRKTPTLLFGRTTTATMYYVRLFSALPTLATTFAMSCASLASAYDTVVLLTALLVVVSNLMLFSRVYTQALRHGFLVGRLYYALVGLTVSCRLLRENVVAHLAGFLSVVAQDVLFRPMSTRQWVVPPPIRAWCLCVLLLIQFSATIERPTLAGMLMTPTLIECGLSACDASPIVHCLVINSVCTVAAWPTTCLLFA